MTVVSTEVTHTDDGELTAAMQGKLHQHREWMQPLVHKWWTVATQLRSRTQVESSRLQFSP